jgi:arylsulfatase A-like enzyme
LAEVPRDAGYATAIFGKWHLGALEQYKASLAKHPNPPAANMTRF